MSNVDSEGGVKACCECVATCSVDRDDDDGWVDDVQAVACVTRINDEVPTLVLLRENIYIFVYSVASLGCWVDGQ